jgi:DNA-binding HxlR family transcriptional regulator
MEYRAWNVRQAEGTAAFNVFAQDCPSRGLLQHATGRWGSLVLSALDEETLRFNELRRRVGGVSESMLAQTLQALERDGLVARDAQPTNPPHVEYRLTPLGMDIAVHLLNLIAAIEGRMPDVLSAQEHYDATAGSTP